MKYRTRTFYTDKQKSEMWDRWQRGESLSSIGRHFNRASSSIFPHLAQFGGIRPPQRRRSRWALSLTEREEISRGLVAQQSFRSIAQSLNRSPSTISREFASPASPVSDSSGPGYLDVEASIREAFGPIATVPGLTIAATDARHYAKAADAAYRINPFKITNDDLVRFHGLNERLSIENIQAGINFYAALIGRQ